jgi:hypothetical protein
MNFDFHFSNLFKFQLAILGKAKDCYFDELQAALKARPAALAKI